MNKYYFKSISVLILLLILLIGCQTSSADNGQMAPTQTGVAFTQAPITATLPPTLSEGPTPAIVPVTNTPELYAHVIASILITPLGGWDLAFSPDGQVLAVTTAEGVIVYDAKTLTPVWLDEVGRVMHGLAFSPDGRYLAAGEEQAPDGPEPQILVWEVSTGEIVNRLGSYYYHLTFLTYSPDGTLLAGGAGESKVLVWDASTGQLLHEMQAQYPQEARDGNFLENSTVLGFISGPGIYTQWDVVTGEMSYSGIPFAFAVSPDDSTLISMRWDSSKQVLDVYNIASEECLYSLEENDFGPIYHIVFSSDSTLMATGGRHHEILILDALTGDRLYETRGEDVAVLNLAFSPDGDRLAARMNDGTLALWELTP